MGGIGKVLEHGGFRKLIRRIKPLIIYTFQMYSNKIPYI